MGKYTSIISSCLIFLISLFFFKAIFPALVSALAFLLGLILFEIVWDFRQSPAFPIFIKPAADLLISMVVVLSFYALIYLPLEFQITENWMLAAKISPIFGFSFLLIFVALFSSVNWNKFLASKMPRLLFLVFVTICGLIYFRYRQEKLTREYLPKIYRVSPDCGIQASLIKIEGVNFFPVWKKGKAMLDGEEMIIKDWNEKLVIIEQVVSGKFGPARLYIKRSDGVISNSVSFEVKDPSYLMSL